jgi:hypothetical protein
LIFLVSNFVVLIREAYGSGSWKMIRIRIRNTAAGRMNKGKKKKEIMGKRKRKKEGSRERGG